VEDFRSLKPKVKIPTLSPKTRQGWGTSFVSFAELLSVRDDEIDYARLVSGED